MFKRCLIPGAVGFIGCFFSIYWLPFARVPLTLEALLQTILFPVDFLLGGIAFLIGIWAHSIVVFHWWHTRKMPAFKHVLFGGILCMPGSLAVFSIKMTIGFYTFVFMLSFLHRRT
ncbi:hypothetical protein ACFFGV_05875 [Pontibacillus salicampi]|uniref:Uncharacterized protein n=1 Tax=Pontibacillus salicampi TaxID=1449801 RepID=A0ABV6LLG0_9BACI